MRRLRIFVIHDFRAPIVGFEFYFPSISVKPIFFNWNSIEREVKAIKWNVQWRKMRIFFTQEPWKKRELVSTKANIFVHLLTSIAKREDSRYKRKCLVYAAWFLEPRFFSSLFSENFGRNSRKLGFLFRVPGIRHIFLRKIYMLQLDGRWYMVWSFSYTLWVLPVTSQKSNVKYHRGYLWSPKAVVDKSDWFCLS